MAKTEKKKLRHTESRNRAKFADVTFFPKAYDDKRERILRCKMQKSCKISADSTDFAKRNEKNADASGKLG